MREVMVGFGRGWKAMLHGDGRGRAFQVPEMSLARGQPEDVPGTCHGGRIRPNDTGTFGARWGRFGYLKHPSSVVPVQQGLPENLMGEAMRPLLTEDGRTAIGEEGSWVSMAVFFFLMNIGLVHDLPLLLLPTLLLKNVINGGRYFSARPGLDMGFDNIFIF
ncbi:hypothetical protein F3Y22_tig00111582pilonHSYRG00415 [Hibiscus syriacus]|uniref:Uncharacterized protein n=1 Tax=Hibiscus syriacus TaxID=106335 RepID=A0A6A2Y0L1_HIBSY|nr:hypothetical protein F3Y22_tig00111582pilonHSYRG00415 [Hibiscus syriacus]